MSSDVILYSSMYSSLITPYRNCILLISLVFTRYPFSFHEIYITYELKVQ